MQQQRGKTVVCSCAAGRQALKCPSGNARPSQMCNRAVSAAANLVQPLEDMVKHKQLQHLGLWQLGKRLQNGHGK